MKILKPLVDKGDIKIVADQWAKDWQPVEALKIMENALTRNNNKVDAVVVSNDGTAGGAIQALGEQKLAGKVLVTGQDADLAACQRIVAGTQTMTVYKPIDALAAQGGGDRDAGCAQEAAADGERHAARATTARRTCPASCSSPIAVDKDNLAATVVEGRLPEARGGLQGRSEGAVAEGRPSVPLPRAARDHQGLPGRPRPRRRLLRPRSRGEVHALCGENGAGKSTLIKVLCGYYPAGTYGGEILLDGQPVALPELREAEEHGIALIAQELALVPGASVAENLMLGREPVRARPHPLGRGAARRRGAPWPWSASTWTRTRPVHELGHRPAADGGDRARRWSRTRASSSSTSPRRP